MGAFFCSFGPGVIMCVTFIFFIPAGALLARYYKMAFINTWFKVSVCVCVLQMWYQLTSFHEFHVHV